MRLELTVDDAKILHHLLLAQLDRIEDELVHTDKRSMQREIAGDATRLRALIDRLNLDGVPPGIGPV